MIDARFKKTEDTNPMALDVSNYRRSREESLISYELDDQGEGA